MFVKNIRRGWGGVISDRKFKNKSKHHFFFRGVFRNEPSYQYEKIPLFPKIFQKNWLCNVNSSMSRLIIGRLGREGGRERENGLLTSH